MLLYVASQLTIAALAARLRMDVTDDAAGLQLALEAACSEIEPYVDLFLSDVPAGLKLAILDTAATRYDRTNLSTSEKIGSIQHSYADELDAMMQRIAPYRVWAGM